MGEGNLITLNNREYPWREGLTVADLLKECNYNFPMIVVKINGNLIKRDRYKDSLIPDGAIVEAIHLVSGG